MVASLTDLVFSRSERQFDMQVKIAGEILVENNSRLPTGIPGVLGVHTTRSLDSPVPHCALVVTRIPTWVKRGMTVTVDAGYNGQRARIFTGYVQDRARTLETPTINCFGKIYPLFRTTQMSERDVSGLTTQTALLQVLDYVGIIDRNVNLPAYTMGTHAPTKLSRMPASAMAQRIMDIDRCRVYELNSGTVVARQLDELPGPTPFVSYSETDQATAFILDDSDREDPDYTRTKVIVSGATITEGVAPDQTSRSAHGEAATSGGNLIQPPPPPGTTIDTEIQNELVDSDAKCDEMAAAWMTQLNRVPRQELVDVPGNPLLELTQTVGLNFPRYDVGGNWFLHGFEHSITQTEWRTRMDCRGGQEFGGTVSVVPIADFTVALELEVIGDRSYLVASFNGTGSHDPDGTIVSYAWSDNQTTIPELATITTAYATVRLDTASMAPNSKWLVTLAVTDNSGLVGTVTKEIPTDLSSVEIKVPAIYSALGVDASVTPDGGVGWRDQVVAGTQSCGAALSALDVGTAVYGTSDGKLYRTTDGLATAPTLVFDGGAPAGTFNHIWWDQNVPTNVWACTSTGKLYLSLNNGAGWFLQKDFGGSYPLNRIATPTVGAHGVWVFGGRGDRPETLIQFSINLTDWFSVAVDDELRTDLAGGGATGFAYEAYQIHGDRYLYGFDGTTWHEVAFIANSYNGELQVDRPGGYMYCLNAPSGVGNYDFPGKNLLRSHNGGATWAPVWNIVLHPGAPTLPGNPDGYGVMGYDIDGVGNLYIVVGTAEGTFTDGNNWGQLKVYKSTDHGDNWTLLFTAAAINVPALGVTNGNVPAETITVTADGQKIFVQTFRMTGSGSGVLPENYYSPDGGANFTMRSVATVVGEKRSNSIAFDEVHWVNNGRLAFFKAYTNPEVLISDDNGLTWVSKLVPPYLLLAGGARWRPSWGDNWGVWVVENAPGSTRPVHLYLTTNNGDSFTEATVPGLPSHDGQAQDWFVWDPVLDVVYLASDAPASSGNDSELRVLHPFDPANRTATLVNTGFVSGHATTIDGAKRTAIPEGVGVASPVTVAEAASYQAGELCIILKGGATASGVSLFFTNAVHSTTPHWKRGIGAGLAGQNEGRYVVADASYVGVGNYHAAFNNRDVWHTIDGVNWTVSPNVMPANTQPHHCLFIGGTQQFEVQGVYVISAEDTVAKTMGVFKSTDAIQTVNLLRPASGFASWPVNGVGWQVAVGYAVPPGTVAPQGMVWAQRSPLNVGQNYPVQVAELPGTNTWVLKANPGSAVADAAAMLRRFDGVMLRIRPKANMTVPSKLHIGQMERSIDDGATWNPVGPAPVQSGSNWWGIQSYDRGSDGTLYAVATGNPLSDMGLPAPAVYKSTDHGAIWTKVYEDTSTVSGIHVGFLCMMAHPVNPLVMVVLGDQALGILRTYVTADAFGTAPTLHAVGFIQNTGRERQGVIMDNGRIIAQHGNALGYSDDYGGSWVNSGLSNTYMHLVCRGAGGVAWESEGSAGSGRIKRTTDYGVTWAEILNESLTPSVSAPIYHGMAYDGGADTLYLANQYAGGATQRVWKITGAATATPDDPLDVSSNLGTLFGTNVTTSPVGPDGLAVLSGAAGPPGGGGPGPTIRDKYTWPFASTSIWNMPIGSSAVYVDAALGSVNEVFADPDRWLVTTTSDPSRQGFSNGLFSGDRCLATHYEFNVNVPDAFIIPVQETWSTTPNNCGAILLPDGHTIKQMNPLTRCTSGGPITWGYNAPDGDIYGDGRLGGHGGSGLSSIGGALRNGELTGPDDIRHVLKVVLRDPELSATGGGFVWPADTADSGFAVDYTGSVPSVKMGTLLAIPASVNLASLGLLTTHGMKLAKALQDYGAYVCDSQGSFSARTVCIEKGAFDEFQSHFGYSFNQSSGSGGAAHDWYHDVNVLFQELFAVTNNSPSAVGGGGSPRRPLAPPIGN